MRKKIVAGNWKMNTLPKQAIELAKAVADLSTKVTDVELVVAPPFVHLTNVKIAITNSNVKLAAQNCANQPDGAYTGEISAEMLKAIGSQYVILGHSERRAYYGETNQTLLEKINLALENGLSPIFCCGEQLHEREAQNHFEVVKSQIEEVIFKLSKADFEKVVIAYEPVWAIGTGKTATSEQAQEMHAFIRGLINAKFGSEQANQTSILYGGSCKPSNAQELFAQADVDGGLIGGASLNADDFMAIAQSF